MRIRFSLVLPAVGILLFAAVSLAAWRNRENHVSKNYFWWSSIRLNSDPQNHRPMDQTPCSATRDDCVGWDPETRWVHPGGVAAFLIWTGLPAFAGGAVVLVLLSRPGLSQVWIFMISMPILLGLWYYFVGRMIDRMISKPKLIHA